MFVESVNSKTFLIVRHIIFQTFLNRYTAHTVSVEAVDIKTKQIRIVPILFRLKRLFMLGFINKVVNCPRYVSWSVKLQ